MLVLHVTADGEDNRAMPKMSGTVPAASVALVMPKVWCAPVTPAMSARERQTVADPGRRPDGMRIRPGGPERRPLSHALLRVAVVAVPLHPRGSRR